MNYLTIIAATGFFAVASPAHASPDNLLNATCHDWEVDTYLTQPTPANAARYGKFVEEAILANLPDLTLAQYSAYAPSIIRNSMLECFSVPSHAGISVLEVISVVIARMTGLPLSFPEDNGVEQ